jgi:hypothetical protein
MLRVLMMLRVSMAEILVTLESWEVSGQVVAGAAFEVVAVVMVAAVLWGEVDAQRVVELWGVGAAHLYPSSPSPASP